MRQFRRQHDLGLLHDQFYLEVRQQCRQHTHRVIGDAGAFRRQWRQEGDARFARGGNRGHWLRHVRHLGHMSFECGDCALRAVVPAELAGLDGAVRAQARLQRRVAQYGGNAFGDGGRLAAVEQRVRIADHFRNAGAVGADHRRAAGHCLECRQAEAFVQRREHEQRGAAIQVDQVGVAQVAGQDQFVRSQVVLARQLFEAMTLIVIDLAGDDQLVRRAQRRRQQAPGRNQAIDILAGVEAARRAHQGRAHDPETGAQRRQVVRVKCGRVEGLVHGGRDRHHARRIQAERVDRFLARVVRDRQQQASLAQRRDLAIVVVALFGLAQVLLRLEEGDQVVQYGSRGGAIVELADRDHGVVHIAFEQTGDEHRVRAQLGDGIFAQQLAGARARRVHRMHFGAVASAIEQADALWRHQPGERLADVRDGFAQRCIQDQPHLVRSGVARHAQRQCQRVAPDAAVAAFRLGALEINDYPHRWSLPDSVSIDFAIAATADRHAPHVATVRRVACRAPPGWRCSGPA